MKNPPKRARRPGSAAIRESTDTSSTSRNIGASDYVSATSPTGGSAASDDTFIPPLPPKPDFNAAPITHADVKSAKFWISLAIGTAVLLAPIFIFGVRMDSRVDVIGDSQKKMETKVDRLFEDTVTGKARLEVIDARVQRLERNREELKGK